MQTARKTMKQHANPNTKDIVKNSNSIMIRAENNISRQIT